METGNPLQSNTTKDIFYYIIVVYFLNVECVTIKVTVQAIRLIIKRIAVNKYIYIGNLF
jgi:hypothetical protein